MKFHTATCALLSLTKTTAQIVVGTGALLDSADNPYSEEVTTQAGGSTTCSTHCTDTYTAAAAADNHLEGFNFDDTDNRCTCFLYQASTNTLQTLGAVRAASYTGSTTCYDCESSNPSSQPSSIPSSMPSSIPSSMPSSMPSSIPSEMPSSIPSSIPSLMPSSIPSEMPSTQPSSIPSMVPSSQPSEQPTSQPSESPSAQPSCTPSMAPTNPDTMFLFYPDWSGTGEGCRNDGGEPAYMAANPRDYLSSSIIDCCSSYFGWIYDRCVGNLPGICARALFYPDWEGANQGCIDDGNEPDYMRDNAMGLLYVHLAECCEQHYSWNSQVCLDAPATLNSNLYFPDWEGDDTCKNGGGQPDYMNNSPTLWMHDSLAACCKANYRHAYEECVGSDATSGSSTLATLPGLWYPDWGQNSNHVCKNDNNEEEHMTNNPGLWMFSSQLECCKEHFS